MKYDGPFEIIHKLSPDSYRLRMPSSYGIHPILNIAHLEKYQSSPAEFGERPIKNLNREDFNELPEYKVERIRLRQMAHSNSIEERPRNSGTMEQE